MSSQISPNQPKLDKYTLSITFRISILADWGWFGLTWCRDIACVHKVAMEEQWTKWRKFKTPVAMEATVAMAVAMEATMAEVNDSDEDCEGESLQETSSFASKHNMPPTYYILWKFMNHQIEFFYILYLAETSKLKTIFTFYEYFWIIKLKS